MKTYWWSAQNFGDTLTPIILRHFLPQMKIELAQRGEEGKLLGIGSIMAALKKGDIVWGSGSNRPSATYDGAGCTFLAVRGPLTRAQIKNAVVPEVYGDPAILLPMMYKPTVAKTHKIGYLPHYVDKNLIPELQEGEKYIDIQADWQTVIKEVLSCEIIVASSLHGIICAEAYGVPAVWVSYSDKIRGGDFKYQDYFLGTGRPEQEKGKVIPAIPDLAKRQLAILASLLKHQWTN